jgi:hypothetical protein
MAKWNSASGIIPSVLVSEGTGVSGVLIVSDTKDDVPLKVTGTQGELFSVTDNLDAVLQSVNDITGVPVFEVYADDRVVVHGTLHMDTKDTPATPAVNNVYLYLTASGTTPSRTIALNVKFEDGNSYVIASTLV